jgi:hypothetical protein
MATTKTARKVATNPAAAAPATLAEKFAAALSGKAYPASDNGMAWLAILGEVPAIAEAIADSRAHKYGNGKGLVPGAGDMLALTPIGAAMAESGTGKNGKPNAQAALCRATRAALTATGGNAVCKAAVVFFALTDAATLAVLHGCKATDGNGKATGPRYIGRGKVPCPRWAADYVNGNVRGDMLRKA